MMNDTTPPGPDGLPSWRQLSRRPVRPVLHRLCHSASTLRHTLWWRHALALEPVDRLESSPARGTLLVPTRSRSCCSARSVLHGPPHCFLYSRRPKRRTRAPGSPGARVVLRTRRHSRDRKKCL